MRTGNTPTYLHAIDTKYTLEACMLLSVSNPTITSGSLRLGSWRSIKIPKSPRKTLRVTLASPVSNNSSLSAPVLHTTSSRCSCTKCSHPLLAALDFVTSLHAYITPSVPGTLTPQNPAAPRIVCVDRPVPTRTFEFLECV